MLDSALCRTCDVMDDIIKLHELSKPTEKYPEKLLSDLLFELTNIDINVPHNDQLPQKLCDNCAIQLENAYSFVLQARLANERFLKHLKTDFDDTINANATEDCLEETPMDVFAEELVMIKMEVDANEETAITSTSISNEIEKPHKSSITTRNLERTNDDPLLKLKCFTDSSTSADDLDDLPLLEHKKLLQKAEKPTTRAHKCSKCDKSYYWPQNLRLHMRKHIPKNDWYTCQHCEQKFSRKNSLQAHLKKHTEKNTHKRPANLSERRQAKKIDTNLCKPHGCKLIQCMICLAKYTKIAQLRTHLQEHHDNITFIERKEPINVIAESLYPDIKETTEEQLIARIRKDLKAQIYIHFYSITNETGYELSLDSSETESDNDALDLEETLAFKSPRSTQMRKNNYICELCQMSYKRKYEMFEHQRQEHEWLEAPHACTRCDARFLSEKLLQHHYKSQCKNALKRYICRKCPLRFRWQHNLKTHYRDHRIKHETYTCTECDRSYTDKKSFSIHMLTVHTDQSKLMPCQWCDRKFYRRDYLMKHLKRHGIKEKDLPLAETYIKATTEPNGVKNITCKVCNLTFTRIIELRAHLLMEFKAGCIPQQRYDTIQNYSITNEAGFELHIDDSETDEEDANATACPKYMPYTCELCKVQCRRKFEMMRHQRAMHRFDRIPYECDQCVFKSVSSKVLEQHKRNLCENPNKTHICVKCNYKFVWMENLDQHMRYVHGDPVETKITENTKTSVNINNNNNNSTANISSSISGGSSSALQCPHCDRTYIMQSRLNNHIRDVHIDGDRKKKEAQKKFLCSLCGKETQSASNLVTHMRRHTGEKPFKCDLCDMAFPRHSEMLGHRRKHTGEKPFHCTVCGKDFARSDKLKRHMLIHSGLKPYKCTYCEKSYRQSKDLALHLQQHTGECQFSCGICGERFLLSSTLEKHRMMRGHFDDALK